MIGAPRLGHCALAILLAAASSQSQDFRVLPYVQHPAPDAMSLLWFSEAEESGAVAVFEADSDTPVAQRSSTPEPAPSLAYPADEASRHFGGAPPGPPFAHRLRLTGLHPRTTYRYVVDQGASSSEGTFTTAPETGRGPVRIIFFADCETEPESTGNRVDWPEPGVADTGRRYLLDQTDGLARNLEVILDRGPDLIAIAGDLVESGGEQRDWDEFWKHLGHVGGVNLAGRIPLLPAPGNHEYYEGPQMGRYDQPGSERAIGRFRAYFAVPDNIAADPRARGRYYRLDYGPVTLIALDVTNGTPHRSEHDTNFFLLGAANASGGGSPGFAPGTAQYAWLEEQLADARDKTAFTFVYFHHVPYSVGPHGWPAGTDDGHDQQSGVPVRELTPLFHRFGVDAVIAGHDEIWERSEIEGHEVAADGTTQPHTLHVLDVGIGGDGLRGPQPGLVNPYQRFLVHEDAPEVWEDGVLVSGGKHYGHLEVEVLGTHEQGWQAVLKPVHVFPHVDADGVYLSSERRLYDDVVILDSAGRTTAVSGPSQPTQAFGFESPYPNPFNATVLLRFRLAAEAQVRVDVYDSVGQRVRRLVDERMDGGTHAVEWDATDAAGATVASGVYLFDLRAGSARDTVEAALLR